MKEIEIKFEVKESRSIAAKLKKLGARREWQGMEESYFFDTPQNRLKQKRCYLRLRSWQGRGDFLTLKTKPQPGNRGYLVRDEYEIGISGLKTARAILKHLGFVEHFRYRKHREHWVLGDAAIELDTLKGRHFVEIEAPKKRIDELAKSLGLDWKSTTRKGYISIVKELEGL